MHRDKHKPYNRRIAVDAAQERRVNAFHPGGRELQGTPALTIETAREELLRRTIDYVCKNGSVPTRVKELAMFLVSRI